MTYDVTDMWNLKYDTNEPVYKTDTENRLVVAKGHAGEMEWEFWVSRCKLLYTEWVTRLYCIAQKTTFNILLQTTMEKNIKNVLYV